MAYVGKRLLQAIPLLLGIATITFLVMHLAPGDPMDLYVAKGINREIEPERLDFIREKHGLDRPLYVQYIKWLGNLAQGDFGDSIAHRRPVRALLAEAIPYTLLLSTLALLLDAAAGITLGIISAVKQHTLLDKILTVGSLILCSIPEFWLALILVLVFGIQLGWLPISQTRSLDYGVLPWPQQLLDLAWHLVLPVFVLGIASAAMTARYMRNRLLDVLHEEFVVAARARGLRERRVILRHAVRNALIPIVTIYGLSLPALLGGAIVVEEIFALPGMGRLALSAVQSRDYPVILATSMIAAVLTVLGSLIADICYALIDPRVSYEDKKPL